MLLALVAAGCATGYDDYAYAGHEWSGRRPLYSSELRGPGVSILDPWLVETREGRAIVTLGFRAARRGFVDASVARRANAWFRVHADQNRDLRLTDAEIRTALAQAGALYLR